MRAKPCRYGNSSETSQWASINTSTRYNRPHGIVKTLDGRYETKHHSNISPTEIWPWQRLGVHFDVYSGESEHQGQAQEVMQQLQSRGLLKTSEYVTVCDGLWSVNDARSVRMLSF